MLRIINQINNQPQDVYDYVLLGNSACRNKMKLIKSKIVYFFRH